MDGTALMAWLRAATRHPFILMLAGLVVMISSGVLLSTLLAALHIDKDNAPVLRFIAFIVMAVLMLGVYWLFARQIEQREAADISLHHAGRELLMGLGLGFGAMAATIGVMALFGGYRVTGTNDVTVLFPVMAMAVTTGVSEEIILRGIIFRNLELWLGSWVALAISAALFGAAHLANPHASLLAGFAIAIEAGILLAALYMLTGRLWGAIGLHAGWNFTQGGIFGVAVSGSEETGILANQISGPELLTGGAFGAEASLPAMIVCTGMGLVCLWLAWKRGRFKPMNFRGR